MHAFNNWRVISTCLITYCQQIPIGSPYHTGIQGWDTIIDNNTAPRKQQPKLKKGVESKYARLFTII
jgi:hypothetical protein